MVAAVAVASPASVAQDSDRRAGLDFQRAQEARLAREAERRRAESFLRAYERRRAVAHARLRSRPDAGSPIRASRPSSDSAANCPVLTDPEARRAFERGVFQRGLLDRRDQPFRRANGVFSRTGTAFRPAPARSGSRAGPARAVGTTATSPSSAARALAIHSGAAAFAAGAAADDSAAGTAARRLIRASAIGDFNGDGKDDALLRHGDGGWRLYAMDGRTHIAAESGVADIEADPAWAFAGAGDFNGDGKDDVLLRHADGRWRYYAMDGRTHIAGESGDAGLTAAAAWRVAGVGDFDGDGNDDVLLRHAGDMRWHFYPMDGREILDGGGSANLTRKAEWSVAGIGDLDGDGSDDVLLRKDSGAWYFYPMAGRRYVSGRHGPARLTGKAEYALAGLGDFDGDGKDDALLRRADGLWYYYPMDGREILDGRGVSNLTRNTEWSVAGIGDLDGDGKDDVLLRKKDTTGTWYYYPMDGGRRHAAAGKGGANLTSDRSWKLAGDAAPVFKDCPACPQMIEVPAGAFAMGSPASEAGRAEDEGPVREVTLAEAFAIGVREVTYAEWEACAADGGCGGHLPSDWSWGGGGQPVMDVTWEQARSYAEWLAAKTGEEYRLPTEAEWEYAARAGTETPFYTGATISTEQANYDGALPPYGAGEAGESRARTTAAGTFAANGFGLRDMHGNVAEWTLDCYAPSYRDAPADGAAVESENCAERVVRGGSWRDGPEELRSANRDRRGAGAYSNTLGFRVARGAPPGGSTAETAAAVFEASVSPVVQSKCVNCHVAGGLSGNTRLVFVRDTEADHLATNLGVFKAFLEQVDGGAELILNKIQGVGHGGGVQAAAGTEDYAAMERFLSLLGEETGPVAITPATLFDGVSMEPWRSTLRRAAIVFAGRIPTDEEYAAIRGGSGLDVRLRATLRGLMEGPQFHEFLIRAANDRLLTDRDDQVIDGAATDDFVDFSNLYHQKAVNDRENLHIWEEKVLYGFRRAPLELIAHIVENDLPYTEVLTADYIMANAEAAEAYGATTEFDEPQDVHEFKPSEIVSYYRDDESKVSEYSLGTGTHVINPGNLITDYPHAGILNTTVFLLRYPTTATNRNRARSRWTYYHFLGLDVEKSAPRTTDPVALADTNNPTMHNPACTVCHSVLDPVAGAFQNYGDEGFYRDQWGGLDSLDGHYKEDIPNSVDFEIKAQSYAQREAVASTWFLTAGDNTVRLAFTNDHGDEDGDRNIHVDRLDVRDSKGRVIDSHELEDVEATGDCNGAYGDSHFSFYCSGSVEITVNAPAAEDYDIEVVAWADQYGNELPNLSVAVNSDPYREGDTWYRDMRDPGFGGELVPDADFSMPWLAEKIVADPRFADATVEFWWPAIMGTEIAEPPSEGDENFDGRLLVSSAQAAEVARLAGGFRRGFRGGKPYNLKDLLTEIVVSKWFRAGSVTGGDPVRAIALSNAGATRLLTPEELSSKTTALTGFDWQRSKPGSSGNRLGEAPNWTNRERGYGLLYGGIDSDGITKRGRDLTSMMAGVAQRHAATASCPVVMKDFYLLPDEGRRLFEGVDPTVSPMSEFGDTFEIAAGSRSEIETLSLRGELRTGEVKVSLAYLNDFSDAELGGRDILLDRLTVRSGEELVYELEMEEFDHPHDCHHIEQDAFHLSSSGSECVLDVPVDIPRNGTYRIEMAAWGDQAGDEPPRLAVSVESDTEGSAGSRAIRTKLAELHHKLLGVEVGADSEDVRSVYDLFVDVWNRRRGSDSGDFRSMRCDWAEDERYFDGIADDFWREELDENDNHLGWDWDRIDPYFDTRDWSDPHHVARTWAVVLAYLMTDPRYLHL